MKLATLFLVGFAAFTLGSIVVAVYSTLGRIWRMRRRIARKLRESRVRLSTLREDSDIVPQMVMKFSGSLPEGKVSRVEGHIGIIGDREYLYAKFYYVGDSGLPEFELLVSSIGGLLIAPKEAEGVVRGRLVESREHWNKNVREARLQYLKHRPEKKLIEAAANTLDLRGVLELVEKVLKR